MPRMRVWPRPGAPVGALKFGSFITPDLCTGDCSRTSGKACWRTAGNKYKTIKAVKSMTRRQKTEGWVPGNILAGKACEDPVRLAPGKIPPTYHRSSAATSLSVWLILLGACHGTNGGRG